MAGSDRNMSSPEVRPGIGRRKVPVPFASKAMSAEPGPTWVPILVSVLLSILGLSSCGPTDHSGDPGLITITMDSTATRFNRLSIVLRDGAGGPDDTLFNDSLESPSMLRRLATKNYRGEKAVIVIEGYAGSVKVYEETRAFDGSDPAATKRDTVRNYEAVLTGLTWSQSEVILPVGDTSRTIGYSIAPRQGDESADIEIGNPELLELRSEARGADGPVFRLIPKKDGLTWLIVQSIRNPNLRDSAGILITIPVPTVPRPANRGPEWSRDSLTTWNWKSGGGEGIGFFRVRVDNDSLAEGTIINDTVYTTPDTLVQGSHTLYVQERDADGNWSPTASLLIKVDRIPPPRPTVKVDGLNPTKSPRPSWSWTSGGGGTRAFRYLLDGEDLEDHGVETAFQSWESPDSLAEGIHTLRVQEKDSAGNWSASGAAEVRLVYSDITPPGMPALKPQPPTIQRALNWGSGGDGSGHYRYMLDSEDFDGKPHTELNDSSFVPAANLETLRHSLYVQERDSVGNWSVSRRLDFNAVRLFTLECKVADRAYVLALVPEGGMVRLEPFIARPENDSERSAQERQLWNFEANASAPALEGKYIVNPFGGKTLGSQEVGMRIQADDYAEAVASGNGKYLWNYPPMVPPPADTDFRTLSVQFDRELHLRVSGPPWDGNSDIILERPTGQDDEQWRFMPYPDAVFVD